MFELEGMSKDHMEKKTLRFHLFFWLGTAALLFLDQWSKHAAILHLKGKPAIRIIDGIFSLQYLENRGAAFGILQGQKIFFVLITITFLSVLCWIYRFMPQKRRFYPVFFIMALMLAGAAGNFLDRAAKNYVVDFFYFEWIDFPIFNVADIYVTCGAALFFIFFLFIYKEKDLEEMSRYITPWKKHKKQP